jgi:hypothetical protein
MNTSWIDGMVSEEEMAEEHPRELEKIKEERFKKESETGEKLNDEEKKS